MRLLRDLLKHSSAHPPPYICLCGRLYLLKSLNLSWNNFQGTLPWEFENLRHLVDLFLKNNNFSGKLPEVIKVMDKLENLVLSFNAFTGELPSGMEHMVSLSKAFVVLLEAIH